MPMVNCTALCGLLVHSMFLMYSPAGTDIYDVKFGDNVSVGVEIMFLGALPIHLFNCKMYRFATVHFITDRWTDIQTAASCQ